jgi:RNA polymerase sigma-70 factor (ECF subfamily)
MSGERSDAELVACVVTGGDDARGAEAALCRRFAPRIRLYGLRHLRDEDRARDLVQAVLLAVLEAARAGRVQDPRRFDRFVLGTCRNIAGRMRDGEGRAEGGDALAEVAAPEVERVDLGALMRCLAQLDARARIVVGLSFREERSADEVAAQLGATAGNVRVIRHRAVLALRRCLDQKEGAR